MFLHLGADMVVPLRDVIAIHDMKTGKSKINNEFIRMMKNSKKVVDISDNAPKSFVLTTNRVYLSAISSVTLKKRASSLSELENE